MNDKEFVRSIIPSAVSTTLDDSPFGTGVNYDPDKPMYVVFAQDAHERKYIVGFSLRSDDDAWTQVAETFRQKMLSQLENAYRWKTE